MNTQNDMAGIVADSRAAARATEYHRFSDFGRRHGGSERYQTMMIIATGAGMFGTFLLGVLVTSVFHLTSTLASILVGGYVTLDFTLMLVISFLYFRRERFLKFLFCTAATLAAATFLFAILFITVHYVH